MESEAIYVQVFTRRQNKSDILHEQDKRVTKNIGVHKSHNVLYQIVYVNNNT